MYTQLKNQAKVAQLAAQECPLLLDNHLLLKVSGGECVCWNVSSTVSANTIDLSKK